MNKSHHIIYLYFKKMLKFLDFYLYIINSEFNSQTISQFCYQDFQL